MSRKGFTLVELLVAIVILGVVLTGLLSLITGTLKFSTVSVSTSDRLRELNDVTGYMADSIRRSVHLVESSTINPASATNGGACNIDDHDCFSVVVPEAVDGAAIDKYLQLFYRIEPRGQERLENYKAADAWADENTYVILEYRYVLCDSSSEAEKNPDGTLKKPLCDSPDNYAPKASLSGISAWYMVLDGLTLEGNSEPFSYGDGEFTLNFRVADQRRGTVRYTPADGVYTITVIKRN